MSHRGVVAAGHPVSARAGADALAAGGNAVDGALGAMLAALACEPLLTGLGAGGYMLIALAGRDPVLLDFFVEAPGRDAAQPGDPVTEMVAAEISFGDAVQTFHVGAPSVGTYGFPAGVCEASRRFGTVPLAQLTAPAAALARDGVVLNAQQAYIIELLAPIVTSTPEAAALFAPGTALLREGDVLRQPELGDALERLGAEGAAPFYTGDVAVAITRWLAQRGGVVGLADLAAYAVRDREPLRVRYRGRTVLTNPPPSPGGLLIARALTLLDAVRSPPPVTAVVDAMDAVQADRDGAFAAQLHEPGFAERYLAGGSSPLGSTTHVAVIDGEGGACSVTCSNGSASGVIVPGTGVHLNNMLGESDLNPGGFHRHPPGRRMPSMMSPTVVLADPPGGGDPGVGRPHVELALGSAGSNRIRSAVLQTILRAVDDGLDAQAAIDAPRVHFEDGVVYAEPGIDLAALTRHGRTVRPFAQRNLFFGGVQAVSRGRDGAVSGGGDPRRGGAAVAVDG